MCGKTVGYKLSSSGSWMYFESYFVCLLEAEYQRAKLDSVQLLNNGTFWMAF